MMTQLFIAHAAADQECAQQISRDFEAAHYIVWKQDPKLDPASVLYPRAIEAGIRGSAALVVIWSARAALDEWVERQILFGQRLRKPIVALLLDSTDLPITLVSTPTITSAAPCTDAVAQLVPHLPPADSDDVLIALLDQLTHPHISERKAAITRAAELLRQPEYREDVLAILENIAQTDQIQMVRDLALAAVKASAAQDAPPTAPTAESRHIFGARCPKGHVTYFDKRHVCPASGPIKRTTVTRAETELDELYLKCGEAGCGAEIMVRVDCEGYK